MSNLIYLATPYSDPDQHVREFRFKRACQHAGEMMVDGLNVFSPIAHTHPIAEVCELPKGFDFWERYDHAMMSRCTELVVVRMPGWDRSNGVRAEITLAEGMGLPVSFRDDVIR